MVEERTRQAYCFGSYLLEPADHRLTREGQAVHLRPKSFDLLVFLIQHRGHLVTKASIMETLWPDAYVGESTLKTCIWEIREALDDRNGETLYIKTIPKIGYQFVGSVEETGEDDVESTSKLRISLVIALSFLLLALLLWGAGVLLSHGPLDPPALESVAPLEKSGTESPEAYQAYLKGQLHFDRWVFTEDHATVFANAIQYLTKAIEIDPEFQAAYSMLSQVYFARARTVTLSDRDYAGARNALEKLIEADDSTVLAHEAKAQIFWQFERNWEGAETFYNLAKERDPSYRTGTGFLEWMGRRDEVFATLESDLEGANPLSTLQQLAMGYRLLANGDFERAIQQAENALALEPQSADAWAILSTAYRQLGRDDRAFQAFLRTQRLLGSTPGEIEELNSVVEEFGLQGLWRYHLDHNQQDYPYHRPDLIACSYTKLGEIDKAFEWLARAWALPLWGSENSPSSWVWDPLRSDPRFEQLLREQNLPEEVIQRHLQVR